MNFANVGDTVTHPEHGTGRVTHLLGPNQDEGVRVKLDSGRSITINYDNEGGDSSGWKVGNKSTAKESSAEDIAKKMLGEDGAVNPDDLESAADVGANSNSSELAQAVDRLENVVSRLAGFIPRGPLNAPIHVRRARQIEAIANQLSDLVERYENDPEDRGSISNERFMDPPSRDRMPDGRANPADDGPGNRAGHFTQP
jgi:hypothetical protein